VYRDDWEIVSLLLLSGADPSRTDINGRDVFWLAASLGREPMLARLQAIRAAG
jgi:ankyrin repeat protein